MILLKPGERVTVSEESHRGHRLAGRQAVIRTVLSDDDFYDYLVDVDGDENWIGVGVLQEELIPLPSKDDVIHITQAMRARGLTSEQAILDLWLAREDLNRAHVRLRTDISNTVARFRGI